MESKKCVSCKEVKGIEYFSKNRSSSDGFKTYCKKCASEYNRRYREKHKEKVNERNRKWYEESKKNKETRTQREIDEGSKVCSACGVRNPIENFYKRGNGGFYSECKDCHNGKTMIYYNENRGIALERKRRYYARTRDYHLSYFKKYNLKNSERNVERARRWAKNNPERARELAVMSVHRRRAKLKKVENNFTRKDWDYCKDFFRLPNGNISCAYCNKEMKNATQEHFIPIDKGGPHTAGNIIPICLSCNSRKSASDFYEWYPAMPFYNKNNIKKIEHYFKIVNQKLRQS